MRRLRITAVALSTAFLAAGLLGGCGHKDANMCDFYQALGSNYIHSQGFVPSNIRDEISNYC